MTETLKYNYFCYQLGLRGWCGQLYHDYAPNELPSESKHLRTLPVKVPREWTLDDCLEVYPVPTKPYPGPE